MAISKITSDAIDATDFNLDSNTFTIDSTNNRVGIGTATPNSYYSKELVVAHGTEGGITLVGAAGTATGYLMFADGTTGNEAYRGYVGYSHSTPDVMVFGTSGAERMRILSGGGITFNGDTATANALDDYEEGTWTPVLSGAGGSGTYQAAEASGSYVKIGRVVHVICVVSLASSITGGGSSYAMISGLPYNYDQSFARGLSGAVKLSNVAYNSGSYVQAGREAGSDSDTIAFYESKPSTGLDAVQISEFSASDQISFNLTYFTT